MHVRRRLDTVLRGEGIVIDPIGAILAVVVLELLVTRDASARTHVYTAKLTRGETQRQLVSDLVDRAFGGSAAALVMQALNAQTTTAEEIEEIRQLIREFTEERTT